MFKSEVELYAPVKAFLEAQGYAVKGEVRGCDLVAVRGAEPPVIVELKLRFSLSLVLQGIDRLAVTDLVYLAVPAQSTGRAPSERHAGVRKLCRRVGFGLLVVHGQAKGTAAVEAVLDPAPYHPRKNLRRRSHLLREHARRTGDPNRGGSSRAPIVTAYRQEALRCAELLRREGPSAVREIRKTADAPNATRILYRNVYGWFERTGRGVYKLTEAGAREVERFGSAGAVP